MAEKTDEGPPVLEGDASASVAWSLIEEMQRLGKIQDGMAEDLKQKYQQLHERTILINTREREMLKDARRKQNEVLGERIKVERSRERVDSERAEVETLEAEREQVQKELDEREQKDTVNKYELNELERTEQELITAVDEMKREARARRLSPRTARRLASPLAARARLTHVTRTLRAPERRARAA